MALISRLDYQSIERSTKHKETRATYEVVTIDDEKMLQITTYGSSTRKCPNKASQVIRFNKQSLEQLKKIINENY